MLNAEGKALDDDETELESVADVDSLTPADKLDDERSKKRKVEVAEVGCNGAFTIGSILVMR